MWYYLKMNRTASQFTALVYLFCSLWLLQPLNLEAGTFHVPTDFQTIQLAIDGVSQHGDTVVVAPGNYVENIDYHGKNIFLTSFHYLEEDESYIEQTVIDGGQNGAVVTFREGEERSAVLNGFTITNGSGREQTEIYTMGGGIFADESGPSITNCAITGNSCRGKNGGGGIFALLAPLYLSNVTITANFAQSSGGGLFSGYSEIEFDSTNRCSIFLNEAGAFNDIYHSPNSTYHLEVYLDTASVTAPDDYFIGGFIETIDVLHGKLEPVQHDLWVSPDGDDSNSGTSPDDPLRTITYALHVSGADSLHPLTINLMPGVYSPSGGQHFPLNLRSYVSLIGAGRESTVIDLEYAGPRVMSGLNNERDYTIRSMSILHTCRVRTMDGFSLTQNANVVVEDVLFASHEVGYLLGFDFYDWMTYIDGTSLIYRNCDFFDNHCIQLATTGIQSEQMFLNCRFVNNSPLQEGDPDNAGMAGALGMWASSFYPYPFYHRVENCVFSNNMNDYTNHYRHSPGMNITNYRYPLDIVNCTFADNSSLVSGSLRVLDYSTENIVRVANCLFWDNEVYELYLNAFYEPLQMNFSHNIIQDMMDGIFFDGNPELVFEEGNFSADPLFLGSGDHPYQLTEGSPAIDAGIAFWVVDGDTVVNLSPDQYSGAAPDIGAYEFDQQAAHEKELPQLPQELAITSIHPNPFNNSTTIRFALPRAGQVELALYNIAGQLVKTIIDAWVGVGEHSVRLNTDEYASGVYLVTLEGDKGKDSRKVTVVK